MARILSNEDTDLYRDSKARRRIECSHEGYKTTQMMFERLIGAIHASRNGVGSR